ncbi:MAG: hypothetical protein AABM33_07330 [Pseudomonadota bacterium]
MSAAWQAFFDEIARWRDAGRTAEFWWRDDDAARPDRALSRLIALAQRTSTPLALAAIPMQSEKEIFENIGSFVSILQHGTDHANRAGPHEKKTEFAASEPPAEAIARLAAARRQLEAQAGMRFLPVLAPPWNRLPKHLAPHLAAAGFRGLSQYGVRSRAEAAPGLRQVNTHVDIIAWHSGRGFAGEDAALAAAARHLAAKRTAAADPDEATGWLTHHAVHDEAAWAFLERLFESTRNLSAVAWRRPEELFHIS